jgi:hypothetical protein
MTIESIQDKAPGAGESKVSPALPCVQESDGCVVKGMSRADLRDRSEPERDGEAAAHLGQEP